MAEKKRPVRQVGGQAARVRRTGIAVVHEGELVLPAAGSEAQSETVIDDSRTTIHYHFPVEIEVRAAPDPVDEESLQGRIMNTLGLFMENL